MKIVRESIVGTLESSDVMIKIAPAEHVSIEITSSVAKQFEDQILNTIKQVLAKLDINNANVIIDDKGALDCVLQARLKAAILRAVDEPINWETVL